MQLDFIQGVRCEIESVVVVDNAGRAWETDPNSGGRAKPFKTRNRGRPSRGGSGPGRVELRDQ